MLETEYPKIFPIILSDIPVRGLMGYFNHLLFNEDCFFYSKKDDVLILEGHRNWKTANEINKFPKGFCGLFVHVRRVWLGCKKSEDVNGDGVVNKYIEIRKDKKGSTLDEVLENAKEVLVIDFTFRGVWDEKVFVTTKGMEDKVFETPEDVIKFVRENKFYEKEEIKNEINEEPKKVEKKGKKKGKKQMEEKKEDKKSEKDPFEIKKGEEKEKEDPFGEK